jgi:transcriptional regulator with XRE-family HTH domain
MVKTGYECSITVKPMAEDAEKPTISDERLQEMGRSLLLARKRSRLSQGEVAEKIGVEYKTISRLENGLHTPQLATLDSLADLYGASLDELTGRQPASMESLEISPGGMRVILSDSHVYIDLRIFPLPGNAILPERALAIKSQIKTLIDNARLDCAFVEDSVPTIGEAIRPAEPGSTDYRLQSLEADYEATLTVAEKSLQVAEILGALLDDLPLPEAQRSSAKARLAAIAGGQPESA